MNNIFSRPLTTRRARQRGVVGIKLIVMALPLAIFGLWLLNPTVFVVASGQMSNRESNTVLSATLANQPATLPTDGLLGDSPLWSAPLPLSAANGLAEVDLVVSWSSNESDDTTAIAWGDYDDDGDLDLAVANTGFFKGLAQPNQLYRNDEGQLTATAVWTSDEIDYTQSIAWGDYDADGDLDLAVGNMGSVNDPGQPNRLYRNDNGVLTTSAVWLSDESDKTSSIAWADYDNDGDLDLAVGNEGQPSRLYRNDDGLLMTHATWSSQEENVTFNIAWGDYDSDGDFDLVVGNLGQPNRLYRNDNGTLSASAVWSSVEEDSTYSVAWGDYDNDGDLDLAAGNDPQSNRLYRNDNGELTLIWSSVEEDKTFTLAWGDYDNDNDLDLMVGNFSQQNRLYHNDGGVLTTSAVWSSEEEDTTFDIVWGDYDNDGDLDLAVGNNSQNRLYRNDNGLLMNRSVWSPTENEAVSSVAWGDYDSDGDLDLAVGNYSSGIVFGRPNRLYRNDEGQLTSDAVWSSTENDPTYDIAWGDYDSDGDLDLVVGNERQPNRLYRNDDGQLTNDAVWSSAESETTYSVAWGDYDSDGDLDLAVGNVGEANRLYRNDEGELTTNAVWSSDEADRTFSLAWGDYDGDGDLDLAVGNDGTNRLYRNDGGQLTTSASWSSEQADSTWSVAWADYDGDADLDLAVGNYGQPIRLYRNDNGEVTPSPVWSSVESAFTYSVAWGDYDGDGDLDLAVGNTDRAEQLYRNDGESLTPRPVWSSVEDDFTYSVAWGDYDNDGDLDLVAGGVGLTGNSIYLYKNLPRRGTPSNNDPPYATIHRPGATDDAYFFSTSEIITQSDRISIAYTLFDAEGDSVSRIFPEFSLNGGGQWHPATAASGTITTNLAASALGTPHTFVWNGRADLIKNDNVVFRIRAQPNQKNSPIMWSALGSQSPPFRVEAPWFVRVVDDSGQPVSGVTLYANGQPITQTLTGLTVTDQAGLINPGQLEVGTPLAVLAQKAEQPTNRAAHDGWAYRVALTNLNLDENGEPQPFLSTQMGEQRLVVRQDSPLILFNIVVSVEWDADQGDDGYLTTIEKAFRKASDYLYDATDGQMAFGEVKIYDNAEYWSHADFQISTKNTVRPYAFIGGITSLDTAHSIRVGRFWSGNSGNSGDWDQPVGYRTLIHEFGHYALYLYDEYFVRTVDENGNFTGQQPAACTGVEVIGSDETPTNASLMYYQYKASELADSDRWTINCQNTEQARVNNEPDWQTILRKYSDQEGSPDWLLNTPSSRGSVMAGPEEFPTHLLPLPTSRVHDSGPSGPARDLKVLGPSGEPFPNALVALYTTPYSYTIAIDQGLTDVNGELTIYGAVEGDTIRVASFDGALAAAQTVDERLDYEVTLSLTGLNRTPDGALSAYLDLVPGSEGDTLSLKVYSTQSGGAPLDAIVIPSEGAGTPQSTPLAYSATEGAYIGQVSFAGVGLGSGEARVSSILGSAAINSDYNLFQVFNNQENELASEDGNMQWHIDAGSLPNDANAYAIIFPTGYVPKPLPNGKQLLGSAYGIRVSGAATELTKPGLLSMHYDAEVMGNATDLAIYRWNPAIESWLLVGGQTDQQNNSITAPVTQFGIYALGGHVGEMPKLYLPLVLRQ